MSIDLRKFGEDCQSYGEALGRIRERREVTERMMTRASHRLMTLLEVLAIVNSEPIPNLPAPLLPEERNS